MAITLDVSLEKYVNSIISQAIRTFNIPSRNSNDFKQAVWCGVIERLSTDNVRKKWELHGNESRKKYLKCCVLGVAVDFLRSENIISRSVYELHKAILETRRALSDQTSVDSHPVLPEEILIKDIANRMGISVEKIEETERIVKGRSLTTLTGNEPDHSLTPEEIAIMNERKELLSKAINTLNDEDKQLILNYYSDDEPTLKDLTKNYNITEVGMFYKIKSIQDKLRANLGDKLGKEFKMK